MFALVLIATGILGLCGWFLFVRDPLRSRALAQAYWFRDKIHEFRGHALTLEKHSNEYCAVFTGNEWVKLKETLLRLEDVNEEVHNHLNRHQYAEALTLLGKVNTSMYNQSPLDEVDREIQHVEELINWQRSVHAMLKKVVLNLEVAVTATGDIAKNRPSTSPRSTLVTLADIKKVLLEDEEIQRMSRQ